MFNKDFYPTPDNVIDMMGIDCAGKIVFEPSAGKGNIIMWLKRHGAKQVLACEKHPDLAIIAKAKADQFIGYDFLQVTSEQVSHIDLIVMNPPFSADEKHILHAWEIAPAGCRIYALCNEETLNNRYSRNRVELGTIVEIYGHAETLGDVFSDSERSTDVRVSMVVLNKPIASNTEDDYAGFFMDEEPEQRFGAGVIQFSVIRSIVNRYVAAVKYFDIFDQHAEHMNSLVSEFSVGSFKFQMQLDRHSTEVIDRERFKIELQKAAWKMVFDKMNITKYVTEGVKEKINKFAEQQSKVPFTERNVYRMIEIIVGTREQAFEEALVSTIDNYTRHTHENRWGVEGWKTNAGHLLNRRFIVSGVFWDLRVNWGDSYRKLDDLVKVLCGLTGTSYDSIPELDKHMRYDLIKRTNTGRVIYYENQKDKAEGRYSFSHTPEDQLEAAKRNGEAVIDKADIRPAIKRGEWFTWGFFRIKMFLKGTAHIEFLNEDHWALLNQRYAKIKGVTLPEKSYQRKTKK